METMSRDTGRPLAFSPFAVASIVASMTLVAIANGLMFAYVPIRLGSAGYDPVWAGSIVTALSAGGMVGCLAAAPVVRRIGHPRAYMALTAIIIASNTLVAFAVEPLNWLAARALYGFAINGLFIVSQSWINDAVDNSVRGRVMAVFYTLYIMGLGVGSLVLTGISIEGNSGPLVAILIAALSLLPVGLTRLPSPPPPVGGSVSFARAWRISPVGLAGMLAVGGMSMMVSSFTPIHLTATGYGKDAVAFLLFVMPFGTLLVQWPAGWLSDRTDRRFVLIGLAVLSALAGMAAGVFDGAALAVIVVFYLLWDGFTESLYSVSSAHAGDRAGKDDLVMMSGTMLFAWALSAFIVPGIATVLTARFGTLTFIPLAVSVAIAFAVFVAWRVLRTGMQEPGGPPVFPPHPSQAPQTLEAALPPEPDTQATSPS
jgi:MFS family permease